MFLPSLQGLYAQTFENSVKLDFRLPQSGAALACWSNRSAVDRRGEIKYRSGRCHTRPQGNDPEHADQEVVQLFPAESNSQSDIRVRQTDPKHLYAALLM